MSGYIHRFVYYLSALFVKRNGKPHVRRDRPAQAPSKYFTPRRIPTRINMRNGDFRLKKIYSYPEDLSSKQVGNQRPTIPLTRSSSQISLRKFGSEDSIPFRMEDPVRKLETTNRSRNAMNRFSDFKFGPAVTDMSANHNPPLRDFSRLSVHKGSKSSLEFSSNGEEICGTSAKSSDCFTNEKVFPYKRQLHLKSNPFSHPAFPVRSIQGNSKIPVRNQGRFTGRPKFLQRAQHTLPTNRFSTRNGDLREDEDTADNAYRSPPDVSNWVTYRMDTSNKFERVFKVLSKHKHTTGNLIDSNMHCQWMCASGITVDRDSKMFKQFAGGKVVLTFGEYKFLIDKICSVHELDYWDVLRKMATFQEEEINHEALLTTQ